MVEAGIPIIVLLMYGLGFLITIILLVYFIIQRIEAKKREQFEDRDN